MKVLGMLWKQAGIGMAIGGTLAVAYYNAVSKQDTAKIAAFYAKNDTSTSKQ